MSETDQAARMPGLVHLSRKLENIGKIEKCEGCSCYVDTIKEFGVALEQTDVEVPEAARERIADLEAKHQTTHGCIGCDPCYPVAVSNTLYEISGGRSVADTASGGCCDVPAAPLEALLPKPFYTTISEAGTPAAESCGPSCGCNTPVQPVTQSPPTFEKESAPRTTAWPIETGDYRLGNLTGAVAVATLASENLYKRFADEVCSAGCSICGKVFTENIGIEKMIKNIISNRHIRFLVLCGQEAKGHETGACIKALHANGLDERRRIVGAPGKRPWIKTLGPAEIFRFQQQVELIDLIGCEDVVAIEAKVGELSALNPGPMDQDVIAEGVPRYLARNTVNLNLDRAGFFIIHPKPEANWIMVEHYRNTGEPTCVIEGTDPAKICAEIIERGLISQLDHATYLGRELERAKLSIQLGFAFAQDRAFGELGSENTTEW